MALISSHVERTRHEPRQPVQHEVVLSAIEQVNPSIRLLRLKVAKHPAFKFLPGQWLDLFIPGLDRAGGFTITSTPRELAFDSSTDCYIELAIQESPRNPPAAWLWRPRDEILGRTLRVGVGGSFVWPPSGMECTQMKRLVLVAGGVGINPLISIFAHLHNQPTIPECIKLLYTARLDSWNLESLLFYSRICSLLLSRSSSERTLDLFLTSSPGSPNLDASNLDPLDAINIHRRRMCHQDLEEALGSAGDRKFVIAYVCGPASMTDEVVDIMRNAAGMDKERVLCEKWW